MARVKLERLSKRYADPSGREVRAVDGIDLEIREGEFMVFVGPSGCGKSTTLRMIAGLEEISAGTLSIDGVVMNDVLPKDRDLSMVFQNYALYPHMTVYDNMAFGLKLRKVSRLEIDHRVREAAAMLGLEELLQRKPKALSGGQRQRVAVGRAIVRKPKVFLFDEPLSNLDAKMRASMRTELAKLHAKLGATMIYVTHDQIEAMTMGDRICVMKDGRLQQVAEPLELYNRPANLFVAGFIGSPAMNFFRGRVELNGDRLEFRETNPSTQRLTIILPDRLVSAARSYLGGEIVLGLRPEDLHLASSENVSGLNRRMTAQVEIAEPVGAETFVHLRTGGSSFVARLREAARFEPDQVVELVFASEKVHLFDPVSEKALG